MTETRAAGQYTRIGAHDYFMALAFLTAERSTCRRRKTGAVITTSDNYILGVGFNGVPNGFPHCLDTPCEGATAPSGTRLEDCFAVHAEINALLQCKDPSHAAKLFVTVSPCVHCAKAIANTTIDSIYCAEIYPHSQAKEILDAAHISLTLIRPSDILVLRTPFWIDSDRCGNNRGGEHREQLADK